VGATVSRETLPAGLTQYETGPLVDRPIELGGRLYTIRYHARWESWDDHDPTAGGWLVTETEILESEPAAHQFREGDIVHLRCKVVEDAGPDVKYMFEGPQKTVTLWLPRSLIQHVERQA